MDNASTGCQRILFLNTGAHHNLGDRAMLLNVVRLLRERLPKAELIVDAGVPEWMIREFGLTPVPTLANCWGRGGETYKTPYMILSTLMMQFLIRSGAYRFLPVRSMEHELLSAIDRSDLVWLVGGGYLNDLGATEARGILNTALMGQAIGRPVVMTGQGIGPFKTEWSRRLFRWVATKARSIVLREPESGAREISLLGDGRIRWRAGVDDASSLPRLADAVMAPATLAVHFRRSSFHRDAEPVEQEIFRTIKTLVNRGERVKLFVFSERRKYEREVYEGWKQALGNSDAVEIIQHSDPRRIFAELETCQCAIGMAYHFHLFALLAGTPSLAMYSGEYYEAKYAGIDILFEQSRSFIEYSAVNEKLLMDFVQTNNRQSDPEKAKRLMARASVLENAATQQILETLDARTLSAGTATGA